MNLRIKPIEALLKSKKSVWSTDDLRMLWRFKNQNTFQVQLKYYIDTDQIIRLSKGVYSLDGNYNSLELAQKLQTPSYISLETALRTHGIIQQYSEEITCIGTYPRSYTIDTVLYQYHQMDRALLSCPVGIEKTAIYNIATPERALVDSLYLGFQPDVSNYTNWNKEILQKLVQEFTMPRILGGLKNYQINI